MPMILRVLRHCCRSPRASTHALLALAFPMHRFFSGFGRPLFAATMAITAPVVVSIPARPSFAATTAEDNKAGSSEGSEVLGPKAHHKKGGGFINPWDSFTVSLTPSKERADRSREAFADQRGPEQDNPLSPMLLWKVWQDWKSSPVG